MLDIQYEIYIIYPSNALLHHITLKITQQTHDSLIRGDFPLLFITLYMQCTHKNRKFMSCNSNASTKQEIKKSTAILADSTAGRSIIHNDFL